MIFSAFIEFTCFSKSLYAFCNWKIPISDSIAHTPRPKHTHTLTLFKLIQTKCKLYPRASRCRIVTSYRPRKIHPSLRIVEQNKDQKQIVFAFLLVLLWGWWACGCRTQPKSDILYSICKRKCVWVVRTYITINYRGALSLHLIKKNNHRREKKTKTNY